MVAWPLLAVALLTQAAPDTVLLDFYSDTCPPCRMMDPLVAQLVARGYPVRKVNVMQEQALASQFQVTGVPCFVMLCRGREIDRQVGATSQERLKQMLDRAVVELSAESTQQQALGQSPDPLPPTDPFGGPAPVQPSPALRATPASAGSAPGGGGALGPRLVKATVRLTVEDAQGHSFGSGTIIDAQGGAALVLTCGHIFRESQGKGPVKVLIDSAAGPRELPGKLHSYSIEPDLALVVVEAVGAVQPARVAGAGYRPAQGESVYAAGCDFGRPATAAATKVTAIDKYLGPANVEVAGEPVQGRSGGGLFNARGELVGVCNAADPAAREGMYAGLSSIHDMLAQKGLASVFAGPGASAVAQNAPPLAPTGGAELRPTETHQDPVALAAVQEEAIEKLQQETGAEVICIVRTNSQSKSEIVVLDRPSRGFLQLLSSEGRRQPRGQLTSYNVGRSPAAATSVQPAESADGWRSHQPR
jgi:thiol-disulfide isomerase/thioredoxin